MLRTPPVNPTPTSCPRRSNPRPSPQTTSSPTNGQRNETKLNLLGRNPLQIETLPNANWQPKISRALSRTTAHLYIFNLSKSTPDAAFEPDPHIPRSEHAIRVGSQPSVATCGGAFQYLRAKGTLCTTQRALFQGPCRLPTWQFDGTHAASVANEGQFARMPCWTLQSAGSARE